MKSCKNSNLNWKVKEKSVLNTENKEELRQHHAV